MIDGFYDFVKGCLPTGSKAEASTRPDRSTLNKDVFEDMTTVEQADIVRVLNWGNLSVWGQECPQATPSVFEGGVDGEEGRREG